MYYLTGTKHGDYKRMQIVSKNVSVVHTGQEILVSLQQNKFHTIIEPTPACTTLLAS